MILIVDTGPLVAAFNKKDRAHEVCTELLATTSAQLIVPAPVLTEVCYLIEARNGTRAEAAFLTELAKGTLSSNGGSDTRLDLGRGLVSWPAHRAAPGLPAVSSMLSPCEGPRSSRVSLPPLETAHYLPRNVVLSPAKQLGLGLVAVQRPALEAQLLEEPPGPADHRARRPIRAAP